MFSLWKIARKWTHQTRLKFELVSLVPVSANYAFIYIDPPVFIEAHPSSGIWQWKPCLMWILCVHRLKIINAQAFSVLPLSGCLPFQKVRYCLRNGFLGLKHMLNFNPIGRCRNTWKVDGVTLLSFVCGWMSHNCSLVWDEAKYENTLHSVMLFFSIGVPGLTNASWKVTRYASS